MGSSTTQVDNRAVADNQSYIAGQNSTLLLPGSIRGDVASYTLNELPDNAVDVIKNLASNASALSTKALDYTKDVTGNINSIAEGLQSSNNTLAAGILGLTTTLNNTIAESKGAENPTYTKYFPYAVIGIIALALIWLFGRH